MVILILLCSLGKALDRVLEECRDGKRAMPYGAGAGVLPKGLRTSATFERMNENKVWRQKFY